MLLKKNMYKNIIPGLVSFDTKLKQITNLHICQNINYFNPIDKRSRFHYKVALKEDLIIPKNYEFRNSLFYKKGSCWYYEKKFCFLTFKFSYNEKNKIFYFNKNYMLLPFRIGGLYTLGDHITNMIGIDLFLAGFMYTGGMAFQVNNKNICIISPGFNGKKSILKYALKNGARYIAEDILVYDFLTNEVFTTCPVLEYNFWQGRKIDTFTKKVLNKSWNFEKPLKIDSLCLVKNTLTPNYKPQNMKLFDFIFLCSFHFLSDSLIRAYVFNHNLTSLILNQIQKIEKIEHKHKFFSIFNFNFMPMFSDLNLSENIINKKYWNNIGNQYSKVWNTKVRQKLSEKELLFIVKYLHEYNPTKILDIGAGNGRILEILNKDSNSESEIYGIDIAKTMVDYLKKNYHNEKKIKDIEVNDISKENIVFDTNFDFVTAIRMLKYNRNWTEILLKIFNKMNKNGLLIFSMSNIHSIAALHKDTFSEINIPINYTHPNELKKILNGIGFNVIEMRGFSKIPDLFYRINGNKFYISILFFCERILELIFGKLFLSRYLFVVCKKYKSKIITNKKHSMTLPDAEHRGILQE